MSTHKPSAKPLPQPPAFPFMGTDTNGQRWRRPFVDFTTPGRDPRTYRMFLVEPEVRVFDDPPRVTVSPDAVALIVPGPVAPGDRIRGDILPARFDVQPHGTGPHLSFVVSWIRPEHPADPNPAHLGIERLEVGRVGKGAEAVRAFIHWQYESEGLSKELAKSFGRLEVSSSDIKRIPLTAMLDKALELVRVYAVVDKTYKRPPKPGDGFANPGGGSFRATVIGFDHDTNRPPTKRGRRKRGPTTKGSDGHTRPWHDPAVLTIAADCKAKGMTRTETVAHFLAEHGQSWGPDSVKKMWGRCREVGLLPAIERGTK